MKAPTCAVTLDRSRSPQCETTAKPLQGLIAQPPEEALLSRR